MPEGRPIDIEVEVTSLYGEDSSEPGQDQHDVAVQIGGVTVYSRSYFEPADRHQGDHVWDPVATFGDLAAAEFGPALKRLIAAEQDGRL